MVIFFQSRCQCKSARAIFLVILVHTNVKLFLHAFMHVCSGEKTGEA